MSIKLTKKVASSLLGRGLGSIRIRQGSEEDAKKSITRDDVRKMIKEGAVYAIKEKREVFPRKAPERRKRGIGKRKGARKARQGRLWERKVRSQRTLLKKLKEMEKIDNPMFKRYYLLIKGNAFPDKRSLLLHLSEDEGVKVSEDEMKQITEHARSVYK
jgi:large subunit ribosomal protein L19e